MTAEGRGEPQVLEQVPPATATAGDRIERAVQSVIAGKAEEIRTVLTVLLAEGHVLLEDVPGVGKTQLARAFAAAIGGTVRRIQCTPDLLPSDITGMSVLDRATGELRFQPGPVFANIVIADEINRASPKTQAALLECMAEGQVTVDGVTHLLPSPFLVVATQNPIDMEGTYALPEAQRDRFMVRLELGYPDEAAELAMVQARETVQPLDAVHPVTTEAQFRAEIDAAHAVRAHELVERYAVRLARATRQHADVRLGASPRATLQLVRAAKARAHLLGRDWLSPDDVKALAQHVLPHHLVLHDPRARHDDARAVVAQAIAGTVAPVMR
ncbi:MoxR family ATPase [Agrococcus sp. HG114]|uniref:AAA family ATPase n=1 Tax=Agrococcus sp. HG114 TaxID=2969757 RepID=UPI00215AE5E1|nr:AAA family ATPase [Agrococcus sp. HG114]MCR8671948.1 AAA family ATPase [Agrococcus sp. HG114]